jgi:RNA polymerase sigma factor (sigma-70 family)
MRHASRSPLRDSAFTGSYLGVGSDTPLSVETSHDREQEVERLYRTEGGKLWRAVRAYCGDPEVASDAVSEAFAQVLSRGGAVRNPQSWLWRSAFRIAAGQMKAGHHALDSVDEPTYEMPEPISDVLRALRTLSPKQRAAVILHDYGDLPTKEVAQIMGIGQATVRVHVSQARRRLRRVLEERGA